MVKTVIYSGQGRVVKRKVNVDIVFSFDLSTSMNVVKDGLKRSIKSFVEKLENNFSKNISWRIGFIGNKYVNKKYIDLYIFNFSDNSKSFIEALDKLEMKGDEISLPAIDWGLDFPWRLNAHKFLIHFTDETIEKGWNPERSYEKLDDLKAKISNLGVSIIVIAPECKAFSQLGSVDKCSFYKIKNKEDLEKGKFEDFMDKMTEEVTSKSMGIVAKQKKVEKDIYNLKSEENFNIFYL